jgi:hypothetical protein
LIVVQPLDQHVARAVLARVVAPDQDRVLLALLQHAVGQRRDLCRVQRAAALRRDVDLGDRNLLVAQEGTFGHGDAPQNR